ncbi:helix-turn-helix transcriptional regulator [Streptomyces prunicolor]|uniref:WYL domain-containing protein n=1 Tax=Streptomyces prunicolor TaxID=67348 RepID=A0ABU4FJ60_9ACTN|nr:WYL domain-containing protein [Streptomyces prunicolor]MDV7220651.1 WYL domain-containing protein [Streptomyces prunicolor]
MTPDRFFSLMVLLASRDAVTTQELASALGVSLRTITRDLNWLRDAGLPVTAQRGRLGGVTMLPGSGPDLTRLTPGERDQLSLTGLDEKQRAELDASVETRRALSKLAAAQPRRVHEELLPLTDVVHVDSRPWRRAPASGPTPASLIGAVRRGRRLRIEYDSPRESGPRDLVVDPYGLFAKAGIWYLVADRARVPRMYRLERITTWQEVDQPRRIRESQTLATVAAALVDQWEHNHAIEVSATIDRTQIERAQRIFGLRLVPDGHDHDHGHGHGHDQDQDHDHEESATGRKVTIRFPHLEDVRALLPFGSAITVHGPTEARAHLRDLATDLAQHYAPSPTP